MGTVLSRRPVGWLLASLWLVWPLAAAEFEFMDLDGQLRRPLQAGTNKATVLIFVLTDCPVANSYAPEINRIVAEYAPRHVQFFVVHVDAALSVAEAKKHSRDFGFQCPALIDRDHALVRHTGVTVTPEVAVLASDGRRLYRGRIDDQQAALGKRRPRPTSRDLRDALSAILAGKPVEHPETKAVGCYIPSVETRKN
jgi:hypothetical protein